MKRYLGAIAAVGAAVACILGITCLLRIAALKEEIRQLRSQVTDESRTISNDIDGIYSRMQQALEEQASLLSAASWEYGDADLADRSIQVRCRVTPKEYTAGSTRAFLVCDGEEQEMSLENGEYTAVVEIPLCADSQITSVFFQDGDVVRTQALEWIFSPQYEYLPMVYARFAGRGAATARDDHSVKSWEGLVIVDVEDPQKAGVERIDLVCRIDGQEMERIPVDLSYEGQESYLTQESQGSNSRRALPERQSYREGESSQFYFYLDKSWEIPLGSRLELYAEVTDGWGLRHLALADLFESDDRGEPLDEPEGWWLVGAEGSVYDVQGDPVYVVETDIYP